MDSILATVAMSTPSLVLRYAAAFFFVVVAIFSAYALYRAGKTLHRVDKVLDDVDQQTVPLLGKAGTTLDEVNVSLANVGEITKDVSQMTEKVDKIAGAVEGAVTTPARKAASFSAGVSEAVTTFFKRGDESGATQAAAPGGTTGAGAAPGGATWTGAAPGGATQSPAQGEATQAETTQGETPEGGTPS